ncbi:uncharacterized protein STEHIDRAFT_167970 [Stereum hirsutum FP-91666 SS1]|uniref:uncharacterized protein n=1 Tax=Stereum hirsutum (strain FP-91666) TaxID=721885 RepID=UPI000440F1B2|nr:uncharacterized protein STEHIDRAFT_167970 [Stereum hirsutum FP-91666 SS1]EIM87131.1 hypothetical protein STEHIDRAFT_167970 [Stereum hirsutum FP-91666 SS1]
MSATSLKEKGNDHFKSGRLAQAAKCYAQAEKAAPTDAVYPSNLSAALYELGDYKGSYEAICRSADLLTKEQWESPLAKRLSARIAKCLRYGVRSGVITPDMAEKAPAVCDKLRSISRQPSGDSAPGTAADAASAWDEWDFVKGEMNKVTGNANDARGRLAQMPIFRKPADTEMLYFPIGHDEILNIVEDWGPTYEGSHDPLPLNDIPITCLKPLALLFGGVGDARHVFASIIGLQKASASSLSRKRSLTLKAHMTLIDVQPTILARNLCLFMLLDELMNRSVLDENTIIIKATLFYAYVGVLMPDYCYTKWMSVVRDLRIRLALSPPDIPSWFHVSPDSVPGIISCFTYWEKGLTKKTAKGSLSMHINNDAPHHGADNMPAYNVQVKKNKESMRIWATSEVDNHSEQYLMKAGRDQLGLEPCPTDFAGKREWLALTREMLTEFMSDASSGFERPDTRLEMVNEDYWYRKAHVFVPHSALWHRHEGLEASWTSYRDSKRRNITQLQNKFASNVAGTFKPNPSLFDRRRHETKYPDMNCDAFTTVRQINIFNVRMDLTGDRDSVRGDVERDYPAFSVGETFFDAVVDALKALKGRIMLEVIHDDLSSGLLKIRARAMDSRPAEFPKKFTRMWLSNVPDYTHGPMNTAVYVMPSLEVVPGANATANCLLNTGCWNSGEDFFHNYTLLRVRDAPRFLGCEVVNMKPAWGLITLAPTVLPRPLAQLASRDELYTWLTRTLLCTLVPGYPSQHAYRCRHPNNVVSFVGLVIHLHAVGFPSHWLSEYMRTLLSNDLVTDVAPYRGELPVPVSEIGRRVQKRRVNLDPWFLEFENIIATSYESLPFPISLPRTPFATSHTEIGTFEVKIPSNEFEPATFTKFLSIMDPVISLIFVKAGATSDPMDLVKKVPQILEGKGGARPACGEIYILTGVERFEMSAGLVSWRMSRDRVKKMQASGWFMMAYRFDAEIPVVCPISSTRWMESRV